MHMSSTEPLELPPLYTISKRRQASKLKWIERSIQKSLEQNKELIKGFLFWHPDGSYSIQCSGIKERGPSALSAPTPTVPHSPTQDNSTQRKGKVPAHLPWKSKYRNKRVYLKAFSRNNMCLAILLLSAQTIFPLSQGAAPRLQETQRMSLSAQNRN